MRRRVVITGSGIYCPTGLDPQSVYQAWLNGRSEFSPFPDDVAQLVRHRGMCKEIETNLLHDRKVQKVVTRRDVIGLIVANKTAKSAKLPDQRINPERFGMYVGASSTQIGDLMPYAELIKCSMQAKGFDSRIFGAGLLSQVNPMVMMQNLMNNTLCYGSIALDIRGVNANFIDFQAAGLRAIGEGFESIRNGRADIVLTGGVAVMPDHYHSEEGVAMGFLQDAKLEQNESPVVRSFDARAKGTILSEGSGFVMLEDLEHAKLRGANILAEITEFSTSSQAGFAYVDQRAAQGLIDCLEMINTVPGSEERINLIGVGNGIPGEDFSELMAYQEFAEQRSANIRVTSIKPSTGELSEASGPASVVLAVEALRNGKLGAVHHFESALEPLDRVEVARENYSIDGPVVVTARGFSGVSCALKLQAFNA
jgi:3-oxoacyl-[acyl-carrier-protein] synthase II